MTLPQLAPELQRLPPMLHKFGQNPMTGCSKGSRGLSVPMRESGIFTAATVSPSPSLRQRPSCYTIRAGRNLPDKEFRYLRQFVTILWMVSLSNHLSRTARTFLPDSPIRIGVRTISSSLLLFVILSEAKNLFLDSSGYALRMTYHTNESGVQSLRDSAKRNFPADCPHWSLCHHSFFS